MNALPALVHEALLYDCEDDYVSLLNAAITPAVTAGEPVLVAVPGHRHDLLRARLDHAGLLFFADMSQRGRNPGRIIPTVLERFIREHAGTRVTIVGEPVWPGRSPEAYAAAVQHEALINVVLGHAAATIVCPYDRTGLPPAALQDAQDTHPVMRDLTEARPSPRYDDPLAAAATAIGRPPAVPTGARTATFWSPATARQLVGAEVRRRTGDEGRIAALQAAVNEVATNSLRYSGGPGEISIWADDTHLVCDIRDDGFLADPIAGRTTPTRLTDPGRGLILAHQLCDLVQIWAHPTGNAVRMWLDTAAPRST